MAVLETITTGSTTYEICDATARSSLSTLSTNVGTLSGTVTALDTEVDAISTAVENDCITITAEITAFPKTISNSAISANMVVAQADFSPKSNITSNVTWTTSNGQIVLSGLLSNTVTATLVLIKSE